MIQMINLSAVALSGYWHYEKPSIYLALIKINQFTASGQKGYQMKFSAILVSLVLFSSIAQANTIDTIVNVSPKTGTVQYVNFNVSNAGFFDITASNRILNFNYLSDPFIYLYKDTLDSANFLQANDDANDYTQNSRIVRNLDVGSYILAISSWIFTPTSATSGVNLWVTEYNKGLVDIGIDSKTGTASFANAASNIAAVPVPSAVWLLGTGLLGLFGLRKKST